MIRTPHRLVALGVAVVAIGTAACGGASRSSTSTTTSSAAPAASTTTATTHTQYPLTVTSCGITATFTEAPKRVIAYEQDATWLLLRLGLADRIVDTGVDASVPPPADLKAAFDAIPNRFDWNNGYPSREEFLALRPDFHLVPQAEYELGTEDGSPNANLEDHRKAGVQVFAYGNGCDQKTAVGAGLDLSLEQIRTVGRIFDVQDRAEALIASIRSAADEVKAKVAAAPPVKVVFWGGYVDDTGKIAAIGVGGRGIVSDFIARAGGENVYGTLDEQFAEMSREDLAKARPDIWLIPATDASAARTAAALYKAFPNAPASIAHRYVAVPYAISFANSEYAASLRAAAHAFHPDLVPAG